MNLYTICTPSHETLLNDWFLPTLPDDVRLVLERCPQECPTGRYLDPGFIDSIKRKVDLILRAINECEGHAFVFADVDIQFFRPFAGELLEMIRGYDLLAQTESPAGDLCAGFFACHANPRMRMLWQAVRNRLEQDPTVHEQTLMNRFCSRGFCHWRGLPPTYFGGGTLTGRQWRPGDMLPVPAGIRMHHANFTVGVENKIAQLRHVRDQAGPTAV